MAERNRLLLQQWCFVVFLAGAPLITAWTHSILIFLFLLAAFSVLPLGQVLFSLLAIARYGLRQGWYFLLPTPLAFCWLVPFLWDTRNGPSARWMFP